MKRTLSLILMVVMAAGVLSGCGTKPNDAYNKPQQPVAQPAPVNMKIGLLPIVDSLPFWVADSKNYFKEQGVNAELITFQTASERDAAIKGGQIDGMIADPVVAAILVASGTKVQIASLSLGATPQESPMGILAAPGSGITEIGQLKGVEIAVSTNSIMHYVTEKLLLENGFKPEEIKLTDIPAIQTRFDTLMAGKVKAAILPDPLLSMAAASAKPAKVLVSDTRAKQNYSQSVILFTEAAFKEKSEGIRRMFIGYNRAVAEIKLDAQPHLKMLYEKANLPVTAGIAFQDNKIPFSFAQAPRKEELESVVNWLADKQMIKSKPAYEQLVNSSVLPK